MHASETDTIPDLDLGPRGHDGEADPDDLVWWSRLDRRYQVEVVRAGGPDDAELRVYDLGRGDRLLHAEAVRLAYGAAFGPDVADVAAWQRRVIDLVDGSRLG